MKTLPSAIAFSIMGLGGCAIIRDASGVEIGRSFGYLSSFDRPDIDCTKVDGQQAFHVEALTPDGEAFLELVA